MQFSRLLEGQSKREIYSHVKMFTLKLVRTNLNYRWTTPQFFKMTVLSTSMHLLPRMNAMLDFICVRPVELPGAQNKLKLQNSCPQLESNLRHAR